MKISDQNLMKMSESRMNDPGIPYTKVQDIQGSGIADDHFVLVLDLSIFFLDFVVISIFQHNDLFQLCYVNFSSSHQN